MKLAWGGHLYQGKIVLSCLTLLGSVTVAGIVETEINGKNFSKWAKSLIETFKSSNSSSSASLGQPITTQQVFHPFTVAGQAISEVTVSYIWPALKEIPSWLKSVPTNYKELFKGIKHFFQGLVSKEIFTRLFENLHIKIWQVLKFAIKGNERETFLSLFKSDSQASTIKAIKFLSGLTTEGNNNLRANPNVFNYLLVKWMDDPDLITDKFNRLSKEIDKWINKFKEPSGLGAGAGGPTTNHIYELDIPSLDGYLKVKKGYEENIYKIFWFSEIVSKIKTGQDLTFGAKYSSSLLGNLFGSFII